MKLRSHFVNLGYGNLVAADRIVAIVNYETKPIRLLIRKLADEGQLLDITHGRKTRSALFLDSGQVVLTAFSPDNVYARTTGVLDQTQPPTGNNAVVADGRPIGFAQWSTAARAQETPAGD